MEELNRVDKTMRAAVFALWLCAALIAALTATALRSSERAVAVAEGLKIEMEKMQRDAAVRTLVLELCQPGPIEPGRLAGRLDVLTDYGKRPIEGEKTRRWLANVKAALLKAMGSSDNALDAATAEALRKEGLDCVP